MKKKIILPIGLLALCSLIIRCSEDEPQIKITSFSFDAASVEVVEGTTVNLEDYIVVEGEDADQAEIVFSSDDEDVVSVSGVTLTAEGVGQATVEATETNTNKSATIEVTVIADNVPVTGVSLEEESLTLEIGSTSQLTATITPSDATNKNLIWSIEFPSEGKKSDDDPTSIATISDEGLVTAVSLGEVVAIVTSEDSEFSASAEVEVTGIMVTEVSIDQETAELNVGETLQLTTTIVPEDATDQSITWSVDFPSAGKNQESTPEETATVDEEGLITAVSAGEVVVTAQSSNGSVAASLDVTVSNVAVTSVSIMETLSVNIGETGQLTATILPENATNQTVTWSLTEDDSSPETYATVDPETGVVTGISECDACGLALVVTTEDGGFTTYADLFIEYVSVTSITLSPSSFTLDPGETQQMTATILPTNATDQEVDWSLSYAGNLCDVPPIENFASISEDGIVTANASFEACSGINVVAASESGAGVSTTSNFTVNPILATSVEIVDSSDDPYPDKELTVFDSGCSVSVSLYIAVEPDDVTDGTVTWSVDDEMQATIDSNGTLDFSGPGTVRVTATSNDGSGLSDYLDVTFEGCI